MKLNVAEGFNYYIKLLPLVLFLQSCIFSTARKVKNGYRGEFIGQNFYQQYQVSSLLSQSNYLPHRGKTSANPWTEWQLHFPWYIHIIHNQWGRNFRKDLHFSTTKWYNKEADCVSRTTESLGGETDFNRCGNSMKNIIEERKIHTLFPRLGPDGHWRPFHEQFFSLHCPTEDLVFNQVIVFIAILGYWVNITNIKT